MFKRLTQLGRLGVAQLLLLGRHRRRVLAFGLHHLQRAVQVDVQLGLQV